MWVTIYTDGSFSPQQELSSYAYYIKSNQGVIKGSGVCPEFVNKPSEAEMYAIVMSVGKAVKEISNITTICINTDCMYALNKFTGVGKKEKNTNFKDLIDRCLGYMDDNNINFVVKHVKAHTGNSDVRSWCNNECDKEARKARKDRHKSIKEKRNNE